MDLQRAGELISGCRSIKQMGKVDKVVGMSIEAIGVRAKIGEMCRIYLDENQYLMSEVVGFNEEKVVIMPYGDNTGIGPGSLVEPTGEQLTIRVSNKLQGRILDGLGNPIDDGEEITDSVSYSVMGKASNPLGRPRIREQINIGVKAIDSLLTCGRGQRIGIFAGSGVGKSTLLGMIAKNVDADVTVIGLIGERGREVREFIERDLGEEGMKKTVLVVATSDQPAMVRLKSAFVATAIAEFFKDQGKNVMLLMDSLTRFAMAQREIGLATGEPPVARGYTPSVYTLMPKLLERSGNFKVGSITGMYTVLVEGDDVNEPISDTVRGIVDGHIVLSRTIAMRNHYPAIDILGSISRVMNDIVDKKHLEIANNIRRIMSVYYQNFDLISIGAYKAGVNPELDKAIKVIDNINAFLTQETDEAFTYEETFNRMRKSIQ